MYTIPVALFWGWLCYAFTGSTNQKNGASAAFISLGVYAMILVVATAKEGTLSSFGITGTNILIAISGAIGASMGASVNEQVDKPNE